MGRKKARRSAANATIRLVTSSSAVRMDAPGSFIVSDHDIAMRAYDKWIARGRPLGDGERDWFAAQDELRSERSQARPAIRAVN